MASIQKTFALAIVLAVLILLAAGGLKGRQWLQQRAIARDLTRAEQLLAQGQASQAEQILAPLLERARRPAAWTPRALTARFKALQAMGDATTAQTLAARVLDERNPWVQPPDEAWGRAHLALAEAALRQRQLEAARQHAEAVRAQSDPQAFGRDEATLILGRVELATPGQIELGRSHLAELWERLPEDAPSRPAVAHALGEVNLRMLMYPEQYTSDTIHVLAKGDTLDRLSRRYRISADLLMKINQISDPRRLRIGQRIKIPAVDFSIIVNKTDNTLTLNNHGRFFKQYRVRTGQYDYMTPVGDFRILNKMKDPQWTSPRDHKIYPPGDPANELGARWMGFHGGSLGIHEAIDPNTIGTYGSNGCVGLKKEDVEELFDLVSVGTPVKIIGQMSAAPLPSPTPTVKP